jgi:hypothetical protein
MTEAEAAEKLAALLNEIEEAGHVVCFGDNRLGVGQVTHIAEPSYDGEPWEVRSL